LLGVKGEKTAITDIEGAFIRTEGWISLHVKTFKRTGYPPERFSCLRSRYGIIKSGCD